MGEEVKEGRVGGGGSLMGKMGEGVGGGMLKVNGRREEIWSVEKWFKEEVRNVDG
ncbi:hypothetical protein [Kocuria rosea]|uniref:hypothetical protein n=1 Tax=Kocuria rosea TaxID=1275 RepID=UPI001643A732|nr:hypothetical protein [Kocuria rosea]